MGKTVLKQSDLLKSPSAWAGTNLWIGKTTKVQTPTYKTFSNQSVDYSKQQSVDPTLWKYQSTAPMMSTVADNNAANKTTGLQPKGTVNNNTANKTTVNPDIQTTWVNYSPDIEYKNTPWDLAPWVWWATPLKWTTPTWVVPTGTTATPTGTWTTTPETTPETPLPWAGTYTDADWNKVNILWYSDLPADVKTLIDWMTDAEKKQLDMIYGNDLNAKAEYVRQAKRNQEYLQSQRDLTINVKTLEWEILQIQASQRLRDAQKNIDTMIQNVWYLWQLWMPWVSATKIQATQKMIWDAQQKFAEMKTIEQKVAQIRELGLKMDTAAFEKQMADISDDLNVKVWKYIQSALNSFTAAELAWELDTIDWVQQFKRGLLEQLDANISGYTEWSMKQMQYVTEQYTKIADDAMERLTEYTKNSNTVNMDLSTARWVYTDGNGNPIYDSTWSTIVMPVKPPLDPIYDKESWKLIMFSTDKSWQIVANVKQVTTEATMSQQAVQWYASLVNQWTIKLSDVPTNMQQAVVMAMTTPQWWWYEWPAYTPATPDKLQLAFNQVASQWDWSIWWQCWAFVNDYLQDAWVWRLFIDPIDKKKKIKNSDTATVWSVAIMDSPTSPQYWHVWIITAINGNQYTIKQSNWWEWLKNKVYTSTATDNWDWTFTITWPSGKSYTTNSYGFFDPMKSPTAAWPSTWWWELPNQTNETLANALANYDISIQDLPWMWATSWQAKKDIIARAIAINPEFDTKTSKTRMEFAKKRTSWDMNINKLAVNTTLWHISTLMDNIEWLWNKNFKPINQVKNWLYDVTWNPAVVAAWVTAQAVASEIAKVFKWWAASPTEDEIAERKKLLNTNMSPAQWKATIANQTYLLSSRLKWLTNTYKSTMWKYPDINEVIYPESQYTLKRIWLDPAKFAWMTETTANTTSDNDPLGIR
jgi:hypothetical protein